MEFNVENRTKNENELKTIEEKITDAAINAGDTEVRNSSVSIVLLVMKPFL